MIEKITHEGEVAAIVARDTRQVENVEFLTRDEDSLQVGLLRRHPRHQVAPHRRGYRAQLISSMHQVIYVLEGKLRLTLYDENTEQVIRSLELIAGDMAVLQKHAHGVDFLEETLILEVKQGPYPGERNAKLLLEHPAEPA